MTQIMSCYGQHVVWHLLPGLMPQPISPWETLLWITQFNLVCGSELLRLIHSGRESHSSLARCRQTHARCLRCWHTCWFGGQQAGPLFQFQDGKPLTRQRFVSAVRDVLKKAGVQAGRYAGHSFQIGAVTTAAARGMEVSIIKMLG